MSFHAKSLQCLLYRRGRVAGPEHKRRCGTTNRFGATIYRIAMNSDIVFR